MYKIMSVNAGSSSLKFKLFEMPEEKVITSGIADRIGHDDAIFKIDRLDGSTRKDVLPIKDHAEGVRLLVDALISEGIISSLEEIKGIGHRIVQGGKYFDDSAIFNKETEDKVESLIPLAPLHNGAHLVGFRSFQKILPEVGNVAVFDTAFHMSMKPEDYLYALPLEYYEKYAVRRYGAHGTSHHYLADKAIKDYLNGDASKKIITCHVGSGASLCAIKDGKCVVTSMGLTPLAGVMMGTRTGDIDPSVMPYLVSQTGMSADEIYQIFNKKSGLLGVSGISNDTRDIEAAIEKGDKNAILATKMFAMRIASYIGQYFVRLGGADLIVFSAGIGENSPEFRKYIIDECKDALHLVLDEKVNAEVRFGREGYISTKESAIPMVVIPTDEELMIARDTMRLLKL